MRKFTHPHDDSSVKLGHYVLGMVFIWVCMIFLSSVLMSAFPFESNGQSFSKNTELIRALLPFGIGMLASGLVAQVILKRRLRSFITTRTTFDFKRFFLAFGCWFALLTLSFFVIYSQNKSLFSWNFNSSNFIFLFGISVILIPIQTGFEEVFFRGFLIQFFGKFLSKGIWIVLSSGVVFGLLHSLNPEVALLGIPAMIFYIVSGIFTALLAVLDEGLELPWGFHLANNLFHVLVVSNTWQVLQTDALFIDQSKPTAGIEFIVTIGVFYPLLLLVFHRMYRWGSWKHKLLN